MAGSSPSGQREQGRPRTRHSEHASSSRKDWANSRAVRGALCVFTIAQQQQVPTPIDNFSKTLSRSKRLVALHRELHTRPGRPYQHVSDLLRSSLVLAVAALDGLVFEASVHAVPRAARKKLLGDTAVKWAKESPDAMVQGLAETDPAEAFAELIRPNLENLTFQRAAMIEGHLKGLLGADPPWDQASTLLNGRYSAARVRELLDDLVLRRHRIAHSGDLTPSGSTKTIRVEYLADGLEIIQAVGEAVDWVIRQRIR